VKSSNSGGLLSTLIHHRIFTVEEFKLKNATLKPKIWRASTQKETAIRDGKKNHWKLANFW
jgi:hypothetical protein